MNIFDDATRTDQRLRRENESIFDYANRSGRPSVAWIREILEVWFDKYPHHEKAHLRGRLRSRIDLQHQGAFFELYLHELLCSIGYELEIEPKMPGETTTHADFRVSLGGKPCFYLEAAVAGESDAEAAENARMAKFYDTLNRLNSPNFMLSVYRSGIPAPSPPCRPLRRLLDSWLSSLDPDDVARLADSEGIERLPTREWSREDFALTFTAIPKRGEYRGQSDAPVICLKAASGAEVVTTHVSVRNAVKRKATKYKELDLPYIVAVNIIDPFASQDDLLNALFGEKQITLSRRARAYWVQRESRAPNGAWVGPRGPHNTRVSAVLAGFNLTPMVSATRAPEMIHNPWASLPLASDLWPLAQLVPDLKSNRIDSIPGKAPAYFLALPQPCPLPR